MSILRLLLKSLLIALLLVLVALVATVLLVDPDRFRTPIEELASEAIGRPLRIDGPIAWSLEHGPGLSGEQVRLANPGWASAAAFATASSASVALSWPALLRGEVDLAWLGLKDLRLNLQRDGERRNWTFGGSGGGGQLRFGGDLAVDGLHLSYRGAGPAATVFDFDDLQLRGGGDRALTAQGGVRLGDVDAGLDLSGPTLGEVLRDPRQWPLQGGVSSAGNRLSGHVELDLHHDLPRVSGELKLALAKSAGSAEQVSDDARTESDLAWLDYLNQAEGDIDLGLSSDVWSGELRALLQQGRLQLTLADGRGEAGIDAAQQPPTFTARLETDEVDIAAATRLLDLPGSHFVGARHAKLELSSHGATFDALIAQLRGSLVITDLIPAPVYSALSPKSMTLTQDDSGLVMHVNGTWGGQPFTIDATGGSVARVLDLSRPYPMNNRLQIGGNVFDLNAEFERGESPSLNGKLVLQGDDPSQLSALFGDGLPVGLKYHIDGELNATEQRIVLSKARATIAGSKLKGGLTLETTGGRPRLTGKLTISRLDLAGVGGDRVRSRPKQKGDKGAQAAAGLPAIPAGLDADIELSVAAASDLEFDVRNLNTRLRLEQGAARLEPLRMEFAGIAVSGHSRYHNTAKGIAGELVLHAPALSRRFEVGRGDHRRTLLLDASKGRFSMKSEGANADEWLQRLSVDWRFSRLGVRLDDRGGDREGIVTEVELQDVRVTRAPGKGFVIRANGSLHGAPVTLEGRADPLARRRDRRKLSLKLSAADLSITAEGLLGATLGSLPNHLDFKLRAHKHHSLPPVLRSPWTARGPYRIDARLSMDDGVYRVRDFDARAGDNDLSGRFDIDARNTPVKLDVELNAVRLRPETPPQHLQQAGGSGTAAIDRRVIPDIDLVPNLPEGWDASYKLTVKQLLLAHQTLHDLHIRGKLKGDHLVIDPLRARLDAAGHVTGSLDARQVDGTLHSKLYLEAKRLDLGWIWLKDDVPDPPPWLTRIQLTLDGRGNTLREYLGNASGALRFMGGQMALDTGALDLWTTDLISIAIPKLLRSRGRDEGLLCSVVGFKIDQGVMHSQGMLFNTSAAVVLGSGTIDLANERLNLVLAPEKKRFSLFSVATPAAVTGTLAEPKVGVPPEELALTAGSLALKVIQPWVLAGSLVTSGYYLKNPCLTTYDKLSDENITADAPDPFAGVTRRLERSATRTLNKVGSEAANLLD